MTEAYIYQAAMLCGKCAAIARHDILMRGPFKEESFYKDSDSYPQGPYADGGGEADCPQHCDHCHEFLENPLTDEGYRYVRDKLQDNSGDKEVLQVWASFYGFTWTRFNWHSDEMLS